MAIFHVTGTTIILCRKEKYTPLESLLFSNGKAHLRL
jgi:hypothetical protein